MHSTYPRLGGPLMILVGMLLAAGSAWNAITQRRWPETLPSILIGLSLTAVGYSLVSRARRAPGSRTPQRPFEDE